MDLPLLAKLRAAADAGSHRAQAVLDRHAAQMAAEAEQVAADAAAAAADAAGAAAAAGANAASTAVEPEWFSTDGVHTEPAAADAATAVAQPAAAADPATASVDAAAAGAEDEAARDAGLLAIINQLSNARDEGVVAEATQELLRLKASMKTQDAAIQEAVDVEFWTRLGLDEVSRTGHDGLTPGQRAATKVEHFKAATYAVYLRMQKKRPHAGADARGDAASSGTPRPAIVKFPPQVHGSAAWDMAEHHHQAAKASAAQDAPSASGRASPMVKNPPAAALAKMAAARAAAAAASAPGSSSDPVVPPKAMPKPPPQMAPAPCPYPDVRQKDLDRQTVGFTADQIWAFNAGQASAAARAKAAAAASSSSAAAASNPPCVWSGRWADHVEVDTSSDKGKGKGKPADAKGKGKVRAATNWRRPDGPRDPVACYLCGNQLDLRWARCDSGLLRQRGVLPQQGAQPGQMALGAAPRPGSA